MKTLWKIYYFFNKPFTKSDINLKYARLTGKTLRIIRVEKDVIQCFIGLPKR